MTITQQAAKFGIKFDGRKVFKDGVQVATIRGSRGWTAGEVYADYRVEWVDGRVESGYCYFDDAKKAVVSEYYAPTN